MAEAGQLILEIRGRILQMRDDEPKICLSRAVAFPTAKHLIAGHDITEQELVEDLIKIQGWDRELIAESLLVKRPSYQEFAVKCDEQCRIARLSVWRTEMRDCL